VALLLAALLLLCADRPRAGMAVLGLGVMTKGFPLVVAPLAFVWLARDGQVRDAVRAGVVMLAVMVAVGGAAVAASPDGAFAAVRYHLERPVQIESSPASVLLALDGLGAGEARVVGSHRSDGLAHDAADAVAVLLACVLLGVLALLAVRVARGPRDPRRLVLASLAAVVAFAALGKVLSPQFLIWLVPLGGLAFAWRMHLLAAAVAVATVLTQVEFPARYLDVVSREPSALALVALRNLTLLAALALALRALATTSLERRGDEQLLDRGGAAAAVRLH
jgi:hypothetical protein